MHTLGHSFGWKTFLDGIHDLLGGPEALCEHLVIKIGGCEQGSCDLRHTKVLAIERGNRKRGAAADIELEMDEPPGEDEQLALLQVGCKERVVGGANEPHVQAALDEEQNLGGPRVHVGWVDAPFGPVDAHHRNALCVDGRERRDVRGYHTHLLGVVGVADVLENKRREIRRGHFGNRFAHRAVDGRVAGHRLLRDTKVLQWVGVVSHRGFDHGQIDCED